MIIAPYNFVPLNNEVFYPLWSKDISHDIPFEDGESGEIELTLTAKSPIFIRNNSSDKAKPSSEFCHFVNANGAKEYYIPGSSIKGMIRSVLEIMSFSKIKIDEKTSTQPLGVRDMTNQKELVGGAKKCGFLVKTEAGYALQDCGNILTISHQDLSNDFYDIKKLKHAKDKYEKFGVQQINFKTYKKMMKNTRGQEIPKTMAQIDNTSSNKGTIVFTGDINNKKHEFVFKADTSSREISETVFKNFSKIYLENENSVDGQFWKKEWKKGNTKIPVFYTEENSKITNLGLTQLFKLAYNKTLAQAAKQNSDSTKLDLAETIFGTEKENLALKGRVQFSHLLSDTIRFELHETEQVLGSPNPSYYPNYIRQTDINGKTVNKYITLMDANAQISGWKRYPLQSGIQSYPLPTNDQGKVNHDVTTKFKPLDTGTSFKGKIRFHNLKKVEIGALLSSLTFHGQSEASLHNIGMAKSLGYGKIELTLAPKKLQYSQADYLQAFEESMNSWEEKEYVQWKDSTQVSELLAMSNEKNAKSLKYQQLENKTPLYVREKNDFVGAKKAREYLLLHSSSTQNVTKNINSVPSQKTEIKKEVLQPSKETIEKQPLQIPEDPNGISKSKMRKAILATWQRLFSIFYHPNQIKEFFEGEFITTPPEQAEVYIKRKDNQPFVAILKEIDRFNKNMLTQDELQKLYEVIVNFK